MADGDDGAFNPKLIPSFSKAGYVEHSSAHVPAIVVADRQSYDHRST
jgi:hypothetical protein